MIPQDSGSDDQSDDASEPRISAEEKRSFLFNVALHNNLVNLFTGCLADWIDGQFVSCSVGSQIEL